jgi:hypothetical protein
LKRGYLGQGEELPEGDEPRDADEDVRNQKKGVTPGNKFDWRNFEDDALSLDLHTLIIEINSPRLL